MKQEQLCGRCIWFNPEPEVEIDPRSVATLIDMAQSLSPSLAGGSTRPVYGKCRAEFIGKDNNQPQRYDLGVLSNWHCTVQDDARNLLFQPK